MTITRRSWRLSAAAAATTLTVLVVGFWPEPSEVDVVSVTRGPMRVTVDEDGVAQVRDRYIVVAPVAGRLQRVVLEPGDHVHADATAVAYLRSGEAPLLDLRTHAELTAAVKAAAAASAMAAAERDRVTAAAQRADDWLTRQEMLFAAGAISRDEVETARTAARSAGSGLHAAREAVNRAEADLDGARMRIRPLRGSGVPVPVLAPTDGIVLRRLRESESVVAAGEPLIELGDLRKMEVVADFLSSNAAGFAAGDVALIRVSADDAPMPGHIRRVDPAGFTKVSALGVEEQRVNVIIDIDTGMPPAIARGRLGDRYRVDVQVVTWQADEVVVVPIGALFRHDTEWAVYVLEKGRARLRPVTVAHRNNIDAHVSAGLSGGELVVLHPPDTLADAARITTRTAENRGGAR